MSSQDFIASLNSKQRPPSSSGPETLQKGSIAAPDAHAVLDDDISYAEENSPSFSTRVEQVMHIQGPVGSSLAGHDQSRTLQQSPSLFRRSATLLKKPSIKRTIDRCGALSVQCAATKQMQLRKHRVWQAPLCVSSGCVYVGVPQTASCP